MTIYQSILIFIAIISLQVQFWVLFITYKRLKEDFDLAKKALLHLLLLTAKEKIRNISTREDINNIKNIKPKNPKKVVN